MYQIAEQTKEEKIKMYKKLSKRELIEMLINANSLLENSYGKYLIIEDNYIQPYTITGWSEYNMQTIEKKAC